MRFWLHRKRALGKYSCNNTAQMFLLNAMLGTNFRIYCNQLNREKRDERCAEIYRNRLVTVRTDNNL